MVNERYSDRIMVIPWKPMDVSDPSALQTKANEYTAYVSQEARPTEYTIGEMGDYLRRCVKENHLSCIAFSNKIFPAQSLWRHEPPLLRNSSLRRSWSKTGPWEIIMQVHMRYANHISCMSLKTVIFIKITIIRSATRCTRPLRLSGTSAVIRGMTCWLGWTRHMFHPCRSPTLRYWSTWMCFFKLLSSSAIIGNQNKNSLFLFYRCQVKTVILIFSNITVIELLGWSRYQPH